QASQEAVDIRRKLADQRPDAFLPDLAQALNNLGIQFSDLGRREDALQASQEATNLYRKLADQRPDAFLPDLAQALNNLGIRFSNLGRREDALQASQEAVDIRRKLADQRPDAFLPDLATSLGALGSVHRAREDHAAAMLAFDEGIRCLAAAFAQHPAAFAHVMMPLCRFYVEACQALDQEPDTDMLAPIAETLQSLHADQPESRS
ncbi:MAG: tetratricopeptide repeat protein, partial [Pseudomonadota bacterium]